MEDLYLLTETHPSELSGDGSYFVRQRLDWIGLYLQAALII